MKRILLSKTNKIIAIILSIIGFSASNCRMAYGSPHADYIVKGTITTVETNEPIPYIKVQSAYNSTNADASGNYELSMGKTDQNKMIQLEYIDDDGPAFGDLQRVDTIADFNGVEFVDGDGDWYEGKAIINMDIRMKDKENAN